MPSRDIERRSSVYAEEGTAAHELAQACLESGREPRDYIDEVRNGFIVDEDMVRQVGIYVRHCRRLIDTADRYKIEAKFNLAVLQPPADMYGTADFIAYFRHRQELHVVDLKFGKGVFVPAQDNLQLRYYALGAALDLGEPVSTIVSTVVQPRIRNADPIRSAIIDVDELAEWAVWLIERAHDALDPSAKRVAGKHCRFCALTQNCLAHQRDRQKAAYNEFLLPDDAD